MLSAAPRRRRRKTRKKEVFKPSQFNSGRLIRAAVILAILIVILIFFDELAHAGRIHYGVQIEGLSVGYSTKEQAERLISPKVSQFIKKPVEIKYKEKCWIIYPLDYQVKVDISKTVTRAFEVTRKGNLLERLKLRLSSYFSPLEVEPVCSFSGPALRKLVNKIANEVNQSPRDAGIVVEDSKVEVTSSQNGLKVQKTKTLVAVSKALASLDKREVNLPVRVTKPDVLEAEVAEARREAEWMIRAPVRMEYSPKYYWELKPSQIGQFIEGQKRRVSTLEGKKKWILRATLSRSKIYKYLESATRPITTPARDAQFKIVGTKVKIVPSQEGLEVDKELAYFSLRWTARRPFFRRFYLTREKVRPKLTTEKAKSMKIRELVSSYTTSYNPGNVPRVNNIHLLAESLNGEVVAPGEIFSFNRAVGPRTAQKGYQEAPIILRGELVPAIGGGVCQVGTTLFNAVFFEGYPVVERHNHSFYISNYPTGRDATVSYPAPDFKFKNDTSAYLLIKAWYTGSTITIVIYSTDFGTKVSYETTPFTNIRPFSVEEVEDPTLPKDEQVIEEKGITGRDVTVYRIVRRGGKIVRRDRFFSRYRPKKQIVRVGTKEVEEEEKKPTPEATSPVQ